MACRRDPAIVWGVAPPPGLKEGWIHLLIPKHPTPYHLVVLGPVQGTWTHWTAKGTAPHTGEGCEHCNGSRITWSGYAPVLCWGQLWKQSAPGWHKWVLVVPKSNKEDVDACIREGIFECRRSSERPSSNLRLSKFRGKCQPPPATEPFDVKPYVLRAWGYEPDFPCSLSVVG